MTDLSTLAATLLTNFATIRLRRCDRLWTWPVPVPSLDLYCKVLENRHGLQLPVPRQRLLEDGHRAFFDRLEGGGPDGWRLHFFCLDRSAIAVLYDAGLGECGPGDPVTLDPEKFAARRLRQLERAGRLDKLDDWWWFFD
jgi:hypothetical protein